MLPLNTPDFPVPVKYFLISYRALSDGKRGIEQLEEYLNSSRFMLSDWKVIWVGACTLLRTSIDLFRFDAKSCINQRIREELLCEWKSVDKQRDDHPIFWKFLRKERNNILHEYEWSAFEAWIDGDGDIRPARISLLDLRPETSKSILIMRGGFYEGHDSLDLLKESAAWVEARIYSAIRRAGFDPDETRGISSFKRPSISPSALTIASDI